MKNIDNILGMIPVGSFELGRYPVTNLLWCLVMEEPLKDQEPLLPKTGVSWEDVQHFLRKLNKGSENPASVTDDLTHICRLHIKGFRLPTVEEWKTACPEWQSSCFGNFENSQSWVANNTKELQPVGLKEPNSLGFYDLIGNVWEWCMDKPDEQGCVLFGERRHYCGASFRTLLSGSPLTGFTARKNFTASDLGFRLARTL